MAAEGYPWLVVLALVALTAAAAAPPPTPWWDDWPTFAQTSDTQEATDSGASVVLCGAADDAAWGIWGQRLRTLQQGRKVTDALHQAGLRALSWIEGYGTPSLYIVELRRDAAGGWVKVPGTDVTQVLHSHWNWSEYAGGELRWVGAHTYFDPTDYAAPYTRLHPRYGCPPARYPNGAIAQGYLGDEIDPRTSRVFDATCAKDVLGRPFGADSRGPLFGQGGPATGRDAATVVPDPGYTPEEWAARQAGQPGLTLLESGKDAACPVWTDYARAETRLAVDHGVDGFWVDNFSPWDSFGASPVQHAFGDWTLDRFREHLATTFSHSELEAMGVGDVSHFDFADYLRSRVTAWGGDPTNLGDPHWADPRWTDDPLWRAFLISTRRQGTDALSRLYQAIHEEAAAAGKPDFLVQGNDIPAFTLGWQRGDLDMVSTELTWGWWLISGPRGLMPPPLGSYVPIYRLAREHARSRFVNAWMYADPAAAGKPTVGDALAYQALANHALPMPQMNDKTLGTTDSNAAFNRFVRSAAPTFGARRPVEEVALYHSSSSQLVDLLPSFYRWHSAQAHNFSFLGWGTALTWLHVPWRALPEWKLTPASLAGVRLLIVPSAEVFSREEAGVVAEWVARGGRCILAGACGQRLGEADNFNLTKAGDGLAALTDGPRLLRLAHDPGYDFYQASELRPAQLAGLAEALRAVGAGPEQMTLCAPAVDWRVGLTLYRDGSRWFVDANNTDLDLAADHLRPAGRVACELRLPAHQRRQPWTVQVVSPDASAAAMVEPIDGGVRVQIDGLVRYASVVLEPST